MRFAFDKISDSLGRVNNIIMTDLAKILIFCGLLLALIGLAMLVLGKLPWAGKLPGDIIVKRENFSFYFPLTTCLLLSAILSIILFFFNRK